MQGGQSKAKKENKAKQAKKRIKQAQRKNKPKIQKTTKYSNKFVSKSVLPHYPAPLQSLHKTKYMGLAYHELLNLWFSGSKHDKRADRTGGGCN